MVFASRSSALASSGVTISTGFVAVRGLLQALALRCGQHLLRVLQHAGRGDDVVGRAR